MKKRELALIKHELLIWARETAGFSIETASKKIRINETKLTDWESGKSYPSIAQLKNLAEIYKRPLAVFYLSEVPKKFKVPHDYRKLYGTSNSSLSPQLLYEIRRAQERRSNALELYELLGEKIPSFSISALLNENHISLSKNIRQKLGVKIEEQLGWQSVYQAFNSWRRAIENQGVLVFQAQRVSKNEMRAFSIRGEKLPLIVLNTSDEITPRIFSLVHELVHLALNEEGLCSIDDADNATEIFCNRVAGDVINKEVIFFNAAKGITPQEDNIQRTANKFKVSREVILRRLLINGAITEIFYQEKRTEYLNEYKKRLKVKAKKNVIIPPSAKVITNSGRSYTSLVLRTYYQEKITACTVSNYLDINLKHLPKLEAAINVDFF
jgi:Zn-dependent peptidase ImmA (M78 family)